MNLIQTANSIYRAIKDDYPAQAKIRTEFASLAVSIATDPNASARITSATVNGQTFSTSSTMTNGNRFILLRYIVECLDNDCSLSSTQVTTF